jgi:probable addiction module antidote protein
LNTLLRSSDFDVWLLHLPDHKAKARILARLASAAFGNFGDCESVGEEGEIMKKKKTIYKPFDAAAYLDNDAVIAEYLSAAAEDPNPEVFVAALGDVAKARGIAQIAKDAGLGRESLYKTLSAGAHPRFETINSVLHALGVKFAVVAERES